jgi:hypothetical protein
MVAQRRYRVRKPREKREGREERQNPEEEGPNSRKRAFEAKGLHCVLCTAYTGSILVLRTTIAILCNDLVRAKYRQLQ